MKPVKFLPAMLVILAFVACGKDPIIERPDEQSSTFPGTTWELVSDPLDLGFSADELQKVENHYRSLASSAFMVVVDGKVLIQLGNVAQKYNGHSIRKSFLAAMYGKYIDEGLIDLDATMEDLWIDDVEGLSSAEKQATVRHCMLCVSGVYHPALYESAGMKNRKPERHSKAVGQYWYYNNWDFNVLGTIFEQQTGLGIFDAMYEDIAKPIGMTDFTPQDGSYVTGRASTHRAYPIRITARDLARFGLLMLNRGKWRDGQQVVDAQWVDQITSYHSDAALYATSGYGYMWWVNRPGNQYPHLANADLPPKTYSARGSGGHHLIVIPEYSMVIVHRVNTDISGNSVSDANVGRLVQLVLDARM